MLRLNKILKKMEIENNYFDLGIFNKFQNKMKSRYQQKFNNTYEKALNAEQKLLDMNGVKVNQDYEVANVDIQRNNQFLHAFRSLNQSQGKKKLILLHGYGMNGLAYMKMLKPLMEKYEVHCLDLPGMGLSSRDDFSQINGEKETIDYFVSSLEAYRKLNDIDKFTLVGHSFGGYMSANYALEYPQFLENLVLLSPLGSTYRSRESIEKQYQDLISRANFYQKPLLKIYLNLFKNKVTLQQANQKWYLPVKTLYGKYLQKALNLNEQELEIYRQFAFNMLDLPESSDKALFNIVNETSVFVKSPLENILPNKLSSNIPVHFLFGDRDWMDYGGAYKLFRLQNEFKLNVKFDIIPKTSHQVTVDNPQFITNYLLNL
ncbi:alpha/beta fold hydrolase (macronuclear) [Tetrahymena thermophila SB210]|uniref:Alpha/beta fold hydrolase n=1 Tax=Tetrahymena thermophila (strain SB210) TaxID=312017 RepID=Q22KH7_TETTS|nr:alpha/beta fold hydrolase [Tetrahymena thermophila SB210]EAR85822.2 alpha/beta fold hydrolase [Tetrahymena thermophila SB210]|eukprot:XP_001033485.2 alpha/beta fold hydrolase [Tetrahymena thermophila SB210]